MCSLGLGHVAPPGPSPQGQWTLSDLARLGAAMDEAYAVNGAAVEAGLAEAVGRSGGNGTGLPVYQLTEAGTRAAERTMAGGIAPPEISADWRRHVWQACRVARRFAVPDLMACLDGSVPYDRVYRFVKRLERCGALSRDPRRGTHTTWRMVAGDRPTPPCT